MLPADPERRARGAKRYTEIMGQPVENLERGFSDIAPDMATWLLENVFGGLYQDHTIDVRTRMIVNVAALAALGNAAPQLRNYLNGALRNGVSREQLVAIMLQVGAFAGAPAGINGIAACREVFQAADAAKKG